MDRSRRGRSWTLFALLMLVLTACSGSGEDATDADTAAPETASEATDDDQSPTETESPAENDTAAETEAAEGDAAPLEEEVSLKVGYFQNLSIPALLVASEVGYFEEENLDVELVTIQSSQDAMVLLAQGELDAITGSISAGFFNSIHGGLDVGITGTMASAAKIEGVDTPPPSGVFVRKDLFDSGEVTDYEDMAGRTVAAIGGMGNSVSYLVGLHAQAGGVSLNDMELTHMGYPDTIAALETGAIDLAFLSAPFSTQAVEEDLAVRFGDTREIIGDETQSAVLMGPNLLQGNRQAGVAFMRALVRAAQDLQGNYMEDDRIVQALADSLDMDPDEVRVIPPQYVPADLAMNVETTTGMQEMFLEVGGLLEFDEPIDPSEYMASDIREQAVESLGSS